MGRAWVGSGLASVRSGRLARRVPLLRAQRFAPAPGVTAARFAERAGAGGPRAACTVGRAANYNAAGRRQTYRERGGLDAPFPEDGQTH